MDISESSGLPGQMAGQRSGPNAGRITQNFAQILQESILNVDGKLKNAAQAQQQVAAGNEASLHAVMIAGKKADISMRLAVQIRNKLLEGYQEIMRMQV